MAFSAIVRAMLSCSVFVVCFVFFRAECLVHGVALRPCAARSVERGLRPTGGGKEPAQCADAHCPNRWVGGLLESGGQAARLHHRAVGAASLHRGARTEALALELLGNLLSS